MVHAETQAQVFGAQNVVQVGHTVEPHFLQFAEEPFQAAYAGVVVHVDTVKMHVCRHFVEERTPFAARYYGYLVVRIAYGKRMYGRNRHRYISQG